MSFREIFQTATIDGKMRLSHADEYVEDIHGLFVHRVPETLCPSGVGIVLKLDVRSTSNGGYFRSPNLVFDASSGALVARYESGNGAVFDLLISNIQELPNTTFDNTNQTFGGNLIVQRDLSIYTYNPPTTIDEATGSYRAETVGGSLFPVVSYWGGSGTLQTEMCWDPINNIMVLANIGGGIINQGECRSYVASTGVATGVIAPCAGFVEKIYPMNPPYALAFSQNSVMTQFNYLTGQIMSVSKLADFEAGLGAGVGDRAWCYDRYNHRVLICDLTSQDTDGTETILVRGFNLNPIPFDIMPPQVSREPRVGRSVKVWTRVIGQAGEGLSQRKVTFSDQGVGDVAPVEVVTDKDGYAIASYDGLATGGAETITVSVEQPDALFPPASAQGTGAGASWTPTVHLDFTDVEINEDVSNLIGQQRNWSQGTDGYGVYGDRSVTRDIAVASAELRIESGETGETGTATNGTFGGDLKMDTSSAQVVRVGNELWVGVWVHFPTGFDFSTSSDGLRILQVRDTFSTFSDPDDDIVVEVRLKHGGGTTHTGYVLSWPNQTVTDTRHNFTAHSSVLLQADTWHWIQYYCKYENFAADTVQRLWIDDLIIWELDDDAAQYRDSGGGGSLTGFTANEAIATSNYIWGRADEVRVLRNWEGGAPSDQQCYISNVVWTRDPTDALPLDENGNQYISTAFANQLS